MPTYPLSLLTGTAFCLNPAENFSTGKYHRFHLDLGISKKVKFFLQTATDHELYFQNGPVLLVLQEQRTRTLSIIHT